MKSNPRLSVEGLGVVYGSKRLGMKPFRALDDISFEIATGETLGLVGESGSGKTTIGRAILGLARPSEGTIRFEGRDITHLRNASRRKLSKDIQVVFQDPYTSLNPSMTIEDILSEPLRTQGMARTESGQQIAGLLERVHLPADAARRLPREFSGGQRQRIAIARAVALNPKLIVCDEPVSALDLSTQERVLDLFIEIQATTDVSYLFVSHDLSVISHISHRVIVLHQGGVVEAGTARQIMEHPTQPYTQRLVMSAPVPDPIEQEKRRTARLAIIDAQARQNSQSVHVSGPTVHTAGSVQ